MRLATESKAWINKEAGMCSWVTETLERRCNSYYVGGKVDDN
jgi:hypothetical protein